MRGSGLRKNRSLTKFLLVVEGVGTLFVSFFLTAYLGGLPTTAVLHSEAIFRVPLSVFGTIYLFSIFACTSAFLLKQK